MTNMSHCRFQNTALDLDDCCSALELILIGEEPDGEPDYEDCEECDGGGEVDEPDGTTATCDACDGEGCRPSAKPQLSEDEREAARKIARLCARYLEVIEESVPTPARALGTSFSECPDLWERALGEHFEESTRS